MQKYIIDIFLILILVYTSYKLYVISSKRKKVKLLLRVIAIFILLHLIIFPLLYTFIINNNPESIEIDNKIIKSEKNIRLTELKSVYNKDFKFQKNIISSIINENIEEVKYHYLNEFTNKKLLMLKSNIISSHYIEAIPGERYTTTIFVFDKKGNMLFDFPSFHDNKSLVFILNDYLNRLSKEELKKTKELKTINSNSFWSYRRILPYTLNILFTGNFNPKNQIANIVYFFHNIIVLGFLLSFIITLFQNFLTDKSNS